MSALAGRGLANMDIGQGPWGSMGDMTSLGNRGNSLLTDLDPARVRTFVALAAHFDACSVMSYFKHLSAAVSAPWTVWHCNSCGGKANALPPPPPPPPPHKWGQLSVLCPFLVVPSYLCMYPDVTE